MLCVLLASLCLAEEAAPPPSPQPPRDTAAIEKALEMFFQLGLPDSRGAQWVRASGMTAVSPPLMPNSQAGSYTGNAWLVREARDGTVELILGHSRFIRGRRANTGAAVGSPNASALPQFHIEPADLDHDLKLVAGAFVKAPDGAEEDDSFGRYGARHGSRSDADAGGALLFLAHLHRQGRAAAVREILLKLISTTDPTAALDAAVTILADGRIAAASEQWLRNGDNRAFAAAVDAVCAQFPRGWDKRGAALLLSQRATAQKPAAGADHPEAKAAAAMLLSLDQQQLRQLPQGRNWLLGAEADEEGGEMFHEFSSVEMEGEDQELVLTDDEVPEDEDEDIEKYAPNAGPLQQFFEKKREAARALARLLDDRRFLRQLHTSGYGGYSGGSYGSFSTEEEKTRQAYQTLPRPTELGELVRGLLQPIVPERIIGQLDGGAGAELVLAWLDEIAPLSDEQLAWNYLSNADATYDPHFRSALTYLVKKGGDETQALLQEVFLDPAVWSGYSDEMLQHLRVYVKQRALGEADAAALGEKLKTVLANSLKDQQERFGDGDSAEEQREAEQALARELKKLDLVFKPQGLDQLFEGIEAMESEEALAHLESIGPAVRESRREDAERALFRAAARVKNASLKTQIVQMLHRIGRPGARGRGAVEGRVPPPDDPETRQAILALLDDEDVSEAAAAALVMPRLEESTGQRFHQVTADFAGISSAWQKLQARALASGEPAVPFPTVGNVPAARVDELIQQLTALLPAEVSAALQAQSLDEQLAVSMRLLTMPEWPASLAAAHLRIGSVKAMAEGADILKAKEWEGRILDAAAVRELELAIEAAARDGKGLNVILQSAGPAMGLKIAVESNEDTIDGQHLQSMSAPKVGEKAAPVALVHVLLVSGGVMQNRGRGAGYSQPIWAEPALNNEWRSQFTNPDAPRAAASRQQIDPGPLKSRLAEVIALKPGARSQFQLTYSVWLVDSESPSPPGADEDFEP